MSIVVPYTAEVNLLKVLVNQTSSQNLILRLFSNNITVGPNTILTDLNEVDSLTGYNPIVLSGGSWIVSTDPTSHITSANYNSQSFTFANSAVTLYGIYLTINNELAWCENFTGGAINLIQGGSIDITPSINLNYN